MDFTEAPKKPKTESIVPMINVVFLLLIFFLMTAQIAPPDPFQVSPPTATEANNRRSDQSITLYVGQDGRMALDQITGEAVFTKIAAIAPQISVLSLRVDAALDGANLAKIMARLSQAGVPRIELVVVSQ